MGKEIVYCEGCGKSLREDEFARGLAHVADHRPYCAACRPLPPPSEATPKRGSSAGVPRPAPPPSTRKAIPAAEPRRRSDSRTASYAGGGLAVAALLFLIIILATGGRTGAPRQAPASAEVPRPTAASPGVPAEGDPRALLDLERFASTSTHPEAILAECSKVRAAVPSRFEARIRKVEDRATELRMARERKGTQQLDPFLAQIRMIMQNDPGCLRRVEVEGMLEAARKIAGDRTAEVERLRTDYLKRTADAPRLAAEEAQADARALAAQRKFPEAMARLDRYPAEFRGTPHAAAVEKLRGEIDAEMQIDATLVRAGADGSIALAAERAVCQGEDPRLKGDKEKYLGNWNKADQRASWTVENPRPGRYRLELAYSCAKDSGGELVATVGVSEVRKAIEPTGDFKKYKTVPLGTIILPGGRFVLTVRALSVKGGGLMNLRTLRLIPEP